VFAIKTEGFFMKERPVLCLFFDSSVGGDRRVLAGSFAVELCEKGGVFVVSSEEDADVSFFLKEGGGMILVRLRNGDETEIFSPVSPSVIGLGKKDGFWDLLLAP
jgi:hypothetical protein